METITRSIFTCVKTEGGLLPPDLLQRVADGRELPGLNPVDYHLAPSERLNEVISRSWSRCLGVWQAFVRARAELADSDAGTTLTRERWLLILFDELGYGRLTALRSPLALPDGNTYPISHLWNELVPIHLVTFRQELDKRADASLRTALRRTPHSLMQEYLNRTPRHQWGLISNGLALRLLHDNAALRRAAFVEFDLEAIFGGESYAEFALLWLLCHQSRFEPRNPAPVKEESSKPSKAALLDDEEAAEGETAEAQPDAEPCWLDVWQTRAAEQGTRALDALRDGVADAIGALGQGFLKAPANGELRRRLQTGELPRQEYYRQLRRFTYRLIFLFVAEDRDLLLLPEADAAARTRYQQFYSLQRLRARAATQRGGPHVDLYRQLRLLFTLLREGYAPLGLPGLGSFLFSDQSTPDLDAADLANESLLAALRSLTLTQQNGVRRPVDYRNLDSEELGSVYESLLELHPALNVDARTFALESGAGSERKTTGSHYTPTSLVECLLDSALEPVVADRLARAGKERAAREQAILSIKVLDYAAGSGHMLIGAGRRLAGHLAAIRAGEEEPTPSVWRHAMRDVVRRCLYAVDLNDMAVELCKVALWMESMEPGKPLSFLDAHVQVGNSLIGVTPGLDSSVIPDAAFSARTGDDKAIAAAFKRMNKKEREGQLGFGLEVGEEAEGRREAWRREKLGAIAQGPEESPADVAAKVEAFADYRRAAGYVASRLAADAWTAAFFWPLPPGDPDAMPRPTHALLRDLAAGKVKEKEWMARHRPLLDRMRDVARANRFFHWALEFPDVFAGDEKGAGGGFDVVLSNPPWERIKLQEKEWFAQRAPDIAAAPNAAARKRMIEALKQEDPPLFAEFAEALRAAESESHQIRNSGKYPLCGRGDVNTYAVFAELARQLLAPTGRAGVIVPTGIATDDTTKYFFQDVMETGTLVSLYGFENEEFIFKGIHHATKFCLLTLSGKGAVRSEADFVFFARQVKQVAEEDRHFRLGAAEVALLNPNTRTCPIFRSRRDAELTKGIYRRVPVLIKEGPPVDNPWGVRFWRMIDMSNDSHLFRRRDQLEAEGWQLNGNRFVRHGKEYLPLYEGKMVHHFDHRFGTYEGQTEAQAKQGKLPELSPQQHDDPACHSRPRYWVPLEATTGNRSKSICQWAPAYRRIASAVNSRTLIACIIPRSAASDGLPLLEAADLVAASRGILVSCLNSFVCDYTARPKIGGAHTDFHHIRQFPVLSPRAFNYAAVKMPGDTILDWLLPRVLELTYTAWDLEAFAQECGYAGPPFRWDDERRFRLRAELDAAYFHLYGIERDDVDYIMETFPIVKRKDVAKYGAYRTKEAILEIYDAMAEAERTGIAYATRLDPPPADPRCAHPARAGGAP